MAINIKKIDLSQFMLNEEDEMMMEKMDKERDVMKKKLDRMHNHIKNVNKALDELYYSMDDGQEIEFNLTEEDLEHVKRISNLIQDNKVDFLDDEDFRVMIHSVVGES